MRAFSVFFLVILFLSIRGSSDHMEAANSVCPFGYEVNSTSGIGCVPCEAGFTRNPIGICAEGYDCYNVCGPCPVGYFSDNGTLNCTKCPKGQYQSGIGAISCKICLSGSYAKAEGLTACSKCMYNVGSKDESDSIYDCYVYPSRIQYFSFIFIGLVLFSNIAITTVIIAILEWRSPMKWRKVPLDSKKHLLIPLKYTSLLHFNSVLMEMIQMLTFCMDLRFVDWVSQDSVMRSSIQTFYGIIMIDFEIFGADFDFDFVTPKLIFCIGFVFVFVLFFSIFALSKIFLLAMTQYDISFFKIVEKHSKNAFSADDSKDVEDPESSGNSEISNDSDDSGYLGNQVKAKKDWMYEVCSRLQKVIDTLRKYRGKNKFYKFLFYLVLRIVGLAANFPKNMVFLFSTLLFFPLSRNFIETLSCDYDDSLGYVVHSLDSANGIRCWEGLHIFLVICSVAALLVFCPLAVLARPFFQVDSVIQYNPRFLWLHIQLKLLFIMALTFTVAFAKEYRFVYVTGLLVFYIIFFGIFLLWRPCNYPFVNLGRHIMNFSPIFVGLCAYLTLSETLNDYYVPFFLTLLVAFIFTVLSVVITVIFGVTWNIHWASRTWSRIMRYEYEKGGEDADEGETGKEKDTAVIEVESF